MIIGISGKIGNGKDTVGSMIQHLTSLNTHIPFSEWKGSEYEYPNCSQWEIKKFAYKLKQIVSILTGIPVEDLEKQEVKDRVLGDEWYTFIGLDEIAKTGSGRRPYTVRELLQRIGTDAMRDVIHPNVWVNALMADYRPVPHSQMDDFPTLEVYPNWIITDVRFPNEAKAIKDRGGIMLRVNRELPEDRFAKIDIDKFHTYPRIEHISETALDSYLFDVTINNNGTLEELEKSVEAFLKDLDYHKNNKIYK